MDNPFDTEEWSSLNEEIRARQEKGWDCQMLLMALIVLELRAMNSHLHDLDIDLMEVVKR